MGGVRTTKYYATPVSGLEHHTESSYYSQYKINPIRRLYNLCLTTTEIWTG